MATTRGRLAWVVLLAASGTNAYAQSEAVQPASHIQPASPPATGREVRFSQQPTSVGERVVQRVGMELNIHTVIKHAGQVAHEGDTALRRRQERDIKVLEVVEGRARKAEVTFALSRVMSPQNADPSDEVAQPVEDKTYRVTRNGEQLFIAAADGSIPTRDEFEIVLNTMETFGLPSPFMQYLTERTLHVGETAQVPTDVAQNMMGFDSFGAIQKFELYLAEVKNINGRECAVFTATIAALGKPENPLVMEARGNIVVELATCRTLEATLTGPVSLNATDQGVEYSAGGQMLLAIRSQYGASR